MGQGSGRVAGKVVLVTGGAQGMGAAHAELLVAEGARVLIGDVLDDGGAAVAEKLGISCRFVHLDVTQSDQWAAAVGYCVDEFGRLDALVNNAGIVRLDSILRPSLPDWQQVIDVNLTGAYQGMCAVVGPMISGGGGSIVNISSVEGIAGSAHLHAYVAAKFGLRGITKSAALELAAHNIRVNSIHPGLVHTPLSQGVTDSFMKPIPMRRGAAPDEVSNFVVFLVSNESSYATGAEFVIDGGLTCGVPTPI